MATRLSNTHTSPWSLDQDQGLAQRLSFLLLSLLHLSIGDFSLFFGGKCVLLGTPTGCPEVARVGGLGGLEVPGFGGFQVRGV